MGRNFNEIDDDDPRAVFVIDLRRLKAAQGDPTLSVVAEATGLSPTSVQNAFAVKKKSSWRTVYLIVQYLGGDLTEWRRRYDELAGAPRGRSGGGASAPVSLAGFRARRRNASGGLDEIDGDFATVLEEIATAEEFIAELKRAYARTRLSLREFEKVSGVPYASMAYLLHRKTLPRWKQVGQVLAGCGIVDAEQVAAWDRAHVRIAELELVGPRSSLADDELSRRRREGGGGQPRRGAAG